MPFESTSLTPEEIRELLASHEALHLSHEALKRSYEDISRSHDQLVLQIEWFKRQLFGQKSERRLVDPEGKQLALAGLDHSEETPPPEVEVPAYRRRIAAENEGKRDHDLRFDSSIPVQEIIVPNPDVSEEDLPNYDLVGEKVTCRLAQNPGAYVVLRYVRRVYKKKTDGTFSCPPAPPAVLERSCVDVSFLSQMLIDKFIYHLPLYRQHQRLIAAGVHLSRSTLTDFTLRSIDLFEPIYSAHVESILSGKVLAMDETPIKAGRKERVPGARGQMKTAYFWPIYGDRDEIAYPFAETRGAAVVRDTLKHYVGVLLTDGYGVYDRYAEKVNGIVHAQCWVHARRHFDQAETAEPALAAEALDRIGWIYKQEDLLRKRLLPPEKLLADRVETVRPLVDQFFKWLRDTMKNKVLLSSNPFGRAARYALEREKALRVFLEYPDVPMDTNHLERAIRPIAIGRKNWMFCWTELGARSVGIIQSLLATCRVHGIDPHTYLVDVLQRIDTHPARDVALLTPRLWKIHFAANPLRSAVDRNL